MPLAAIRDTVKPMLEHTRRGLNRLPRTARYVTVVVALLVFAILLLMFVWDEEPEAFDVIAYARDTTEPPGDHSTTGFVTTATLIHSVRVLLDKPGGYLSNDKLPPGAVMDNLPNWEWGVLRQARDLARTMRNDISRSQTQSTEDTDLVTAETKLHIDSEAWMFPSAEREYSDAVKSLESYLARLVDPANQDAQFYARADNLVDWLGLVEKRLGDLSQRLSASVGQVRINTDLSGDAEARQSTTSPGVQMVKTSWSQIDDVFYEARGSSWALIHYLRAVEVDFATVLDRRNATVSVRQIIRELESTQDLVWSPIILNGTGFGLVANHSLVMASYISRANAAVIELRTLLAQG